MKIRNCFVSNSSSTSFVIEFNKNKNVTIKMPLATFLRCLGDDYPDFDDSEERLLITKEELEEKEYPSNWKINENKIKGIFRTRGDAPNLIERLIYELYGDINSFFYENYIKVLECFEE